MKIYSRRHANTPNWIHTNVEVDENGIVIRQWTTVPGGQGGLINDPKDLIGRKLKDLHGFRFNQGMSQEEE
jgi:hypothetical protein